MPPGFLIYGSTGFVGSAIAQLAVQNGLQPIIAGRDAAIIKTQAAQLGVEYRVFNLDDPSTMDKSLSEVTAVLHCAGPFIYTSKPMADGCLRTGTHYLDITGEIPVYESLAARDEEAKASGVMLLPGIGFDVAASDCLALHLKNRLPSATRLSLAYHGSGPAGSPPGTVKTIVEMIPYGNKIRQDGRLVSPPRGVETRLIDFGQGAKRATLLPWGDVVMAFYSTGIPNIKDYAVLPDGLRRLMALLEYIRPLFKLAVVRNFVKNRLKTGSTASERSKTRISVWGEVEDDRGNTAVSRLHGPEGGVSWTSSIALAAIRKVFAGNTAPGFQTPARVYGADFILECEGVTREDLD